MLGRDVSLDYAMLSAKTRMGVRQLPRSRLKLLFDPMACTKPLILFGFPATALARRPSWFGIGSVERPGLVARRPKRLANLRLTRTRHPVCPVLLIRRSLVRAQVEEPEVFVGGKRLGRWPRRFFLGRLVGMPSVSRPIRLATPREPIHEQSNEAGGFTDIGVSDAGHIGAASLRPALLPAGREVKMWCAPTGYPLNQGVVRPTKRNRFGI